MVVQIDQAWLRGERRCLWDQCLGRTTAPIPSTASVVRDSRLERPQGSD